MAARAIWKGVIRFEDISVPVKLYSAVEDRKVHLRLLHGADRNPVRQSLVDPVHDQAVDPGQIRKGYDTGEGEIVLLTDEELAALSPPEDRDIEVVGFIEPALLGQPWFDRPYYLGPDGAEERYFALARALAAEGREGVVRWTMRKKRYLGALREDRGYLTLHTLHFAGEVVDPSSLPRPTGRPPEEQERRMAEQLLDALTADFDPTPYRDEYREKVLALAEAKAHGGSLELPAPPQPKPEGDSLADLLRASLRREGREAHAG